MNVLKKSFAAVLFVAVLIVGSAGRGLAVSYFPTYTTSPQFHEIPVAMLNNGPGYVTPLAFDSTRTLQLHASSLDFTSAILFTNQNLAAEFGQSKLVSSLMHLGIADVTTSPPGFPTPVGPFVSSPSTNRFWQLTEDLILNSSLTLSAGTLIVGYQSTLSLDKLDFNDYVVAITDAPLTPTPIPGALWLLGSGLMGLMGIKRARKGQ